MTRELYYVLSNLVLQRRRPDLGRPLREEERRLLIVAVEQAVVDPHRLRLYLDYLRSKYGGKFPYPSSSSEAEEQRFVEEEEEIVNQGLDRLPGERLAALAVDPTALLLLRAAIFDRDEMPERWWQRAKESANARQPLKAGV